MIALGAVCDDPWVLARIGGALGEAARAGAVSAVGDARAPVPPGLRGVDPSWLETALAGLPPRAREVLAAGPRDEADVWLARRACAGIPPLPPIDPALHRPRIPADVVRLAPRAVRDWLVEVGRDHLAFAAGDHARAVPELAVAAARIDRAPRAGALGTRRDAIARCGGRVEPFTVGVRALAPHLEVMLARALVLRFPRPDGLGIAFELTAHRDGRSGGWDALVAR
ncbi:MAG: hypothetical protein JNL83_14070 [Myxococcales bacterium]|nr:hypothetical protein [Myxococcales bacterium]